MHGATHPTSILMILIASLCGATGSFLYKTGAKAGSDTLMACLTNPRLLGGVTCYIAVMILFVSAFRKGGALTVLYPVYATTFIFAAIISWFAFGTPIRPINLAGMTLLVFGIHLMGKTS